MSDVSSENFGLLIAYILPGLVALGGIAPFSPTVQSWMQTTPPNAPTVAGLFYVTLASMAVGLIISTVRWAVVDRVYHALGVTEPTWDFSRFAGRVDAFGALVENHYRYYQFYANMLVALAFTYLVRRLGGGFTNQPLGWVDVGYLSLAVVLVIGSRDTLRKYYVRAGALLQASKNRASSDAGTDRNKKRTP